MRIWFDTEFIEDGKTIDLISIGAIRDDGSRFYAEAKECDLSRASPWVRENVIPSLRGGMARIPRQEIALKMIAFAGPCPEFWADYCSYDWVALCQLFGTMMQLPKGWPMFCRDIQQLRAYMGYPEIPVPQPDDEHYALADAIHARDVWKYLVRLSII